MWGPLSSNGRVGMKKMVINHLEKLFVTSDAAVIMNELEVAHPAARMIVMASKQMELEVRCSSFYLSPPIHWYLTSPPRLEITPTWWSFFVVNFFNRPPRLSSKV